MIDIILVLAFLAVAIGTYTDIKTLEVPDWLNYSLIAIGIAHHLIRAATDWSFLPILECLLGLGLAVILGMLMYYTGQWGGGDSKMLFGLGAMFGIPLPFRHAFFTDFIVNILGAGALYGLIWIAAKGISNRKKVLKEIKIGMKEDKMKKIRLYSGIAAVAALAIIMFFMEGYALQATMAATIVLLYFTNYLYIITKAVEKAAMVKEVSPDKLTEGDWIVEDIIVKGKRIAGPKDLGLNRKQLEKIINLSSKGKIKKVKVKYGMPFVPSFLIAMIFTAVFDTMFLFLLIW